VEGLGWVLCGGYLAVLVGVVGLIGRRERKRGEGLYGRGIFFKGIPNVDARLALDGCLEKRGVVLHCIWQGVVAFCYEERA